MFFGLNHFHRIPNSVISPEEHSVTVMLGCVVALLSGSQVGWTGFPGALLSHLLLICPHQDTFLGVFTRLSHHHRVLVSLIYSPRSGFLLPVLTSVPLTCLLATFTTASTFPSTLDSLWK